MKSIFYLIIFNIFFLYSQNVDQIKRQLQEAGITPEQAKQKLINDGYTKEQIRSEANLRGIDMSDPNRSTDKNLNIENNLDNNNEIEPEVITESIKPLEPKDLEYYGYSIFQASPDAFQSSTFGAVDPNYNIGPGDIIILMLWGESQFRQEFTVNREGYVFLPEVGQVFVNGLNLEALEKKFFQILSKAYSTLNPQNKIPTTFLDVSLGNIRPLRIIVLGEVSQPGAYSVSPSTSLSSSLYYFNGPTIFGSLRDIRLMRNGKLFGSIDFYDYLLSGNVPDDLRLQLDDVVFIPVRGKTVTIKGQINREGHYELKSNEKLKDLIEIAGNLSVTAYINRAQISRIVPQDKREILGMDRMVLDIDLENVLFKDKDIELHDGDIVEIFPIEESYKNYVTLISTSVMRPGRYQLTPEMRILDLIDAADGLLNDAYLNKAHIKRTKEDLTVELLTINLDDLVNGNLEKNIKLKFMDELIIYNVNELHNLITNITINGPVKNPGNYNLETGKTVGDLIVLSGGFVQGLQQVKIVISRSSKESFNPRIYKFPKLINEYININDIDNINSDINKFALIPYDIVNIYPDPRNTINNGVRISGAVYHPGFYSIISRNEKVSDIIQRAGGLLPEAYPMASNFIRDSLKIQLSFEKIINSPKSNQNFIVMPGDEIIINTKSNIVHMIGEINQPGIYKYYKGYSLNDYIKIAGGLNRNAEKKEIWITHPDGTSKQLNRFFPSPRVFDGSKIIIGKKEESEPFDFTEYAKEITSIFSDLVQVIILYTALQNRN